MTFLERINGGQALQAGDVAVITIQCAMLGGVMVLAWRGRKDFFHD